ncbi:MAG: hypothetical protein PHQ35_09565 [Phycisphaerae bacterium]|nr:hypothetical protein [Phycisphaerae bacterium]MDD5239963.1 hypothetical protein [Candidatus Nanoarchaeia archaeon]
MKLFKQIALYLIALFVTVSVSVTILAKNNVTEYKILSKEINSSAGKIERLLNDISYRLDNSVLLDRLEQLTRENVVLRQEVADQGHQLDLYEGED